MKYILLKRVAVLASVSALVLISACDSGGSSGESASNGAIVNNDFAFPAVSETNGSFEITNPLGDVPTFSARRTLEAGSGSTIEFGDPVVLRYKMFRWSTGEIVESTDDFDEPVTIRAGITEGVPEHLSHSLLGRKIGEKMQIIFEEGMEDLPGYLDSDDAYVLVIELI